MNQKWPSSRGWLFVLPVVLVVAFSAIVPLMTVINYSLQIVRQVTQTKTVEVGLRFYRDILSDPATLDAALRQLGFTGLVLLIQIPLGIGLSLLLPRHKGLSSSLLLVVLAIPLLVPFSVVATAWQFFCRSDVGLFGQALTRLGWDYNYVDHAFDAWFTLLLMDIWHWTPLVVLLCYAGLRAIPRAYYQAADIDGASRLAVFRYIELPKLRGVLIISVLLRFMDSFMIFTEPYILTGGGPGDATTFLSQQLYQLAYGKPTSGAAAAFSVLYLILVLAISYVLYTVMLRTDHARAAGRSD